MTSIGELRELVRRRGDLKREIDSLEERATELRKKASNMDFVQLPDLFTQLGVRRLDIEAEGNAPAFTATLNPYYKAVIQAGWDDERREEAFALLEDIGLGSLVKWTVTATLGSDAEEKARYVSSLLSADHIPHAVARDISWTTLTAAIREMHESGHQFGDRELRILGATIGKIVKLK